MKEISVIQEEAVKLIKSREAFKGSIIASVYNEPLFGIRNIISKSKKFKVHLTEIEKIPFDILDIVKSPKVRKGDLVAFDETGLFKVSISDGGYIYILKFMSDFESEFKTIVYGSENSWKAFSQIDYKIFKGLNKPKKGVYKINRNRHYNREIVYIKKNPKKFPKTEIVHPVKEKIIKDIETFVQDDYTYLSKFNLPYIKKVLLAGKTGTGKTSLTRYIASKFGQDFNVCWAEDFGVLADHLLRLTRFKIPSIVFYEDCESELMGANSRVLNFLDGIDLPLVKQPTYVIATTNHPDRLEERIRRRFDEIFHVGSLSGEYALECAQSYFSTYFSFDKEHIGLFDNMTGWEIYSLWMATRKYCINNKAEFSTNVIQNQKIRFKNELKKIEDEERRRTAIGFSNDSPF